MGVSDEPCCICGQPSAWQHDHRPNGTGLDDGPWLPGKAPRKKPEAKTAAVVSDMRRRAWETRRRKYGERGHG